MELTLYTALAIIGVIFVILFYTIGRTAYELYRMEMDRGEKDEDTTDNSR